jgi:hypothetical protein
MKLWFAGVVPEDLLLVMDLTCIVTRQFSLVVRNASFKNHKNLLLHVIITLLTTSWCTMNICYSPFSPAMGIPFV